MEYQAGWPFWRAVARMGVPLSIHVTVTHDQDAGVYAVTSSNLKGLFAEGQTLDELHSNLTDAAADLLAAYLHQPPAHPPITSLTVCGA